MMKNTHYQHLIPMTLNEAIKFVALHLSFILFTLPLIAQVPKKVLSTSAAAKSSLQLTRMKITATPPLTSLRTPQLPIYKAPNHFLKQYVIRVAQTDKRRFRLEQGDPVIGLYYARGKEHAGFDYFLPIAFEKENTAIQYLDGMSAEMRAKAVVVKLLAKKAKCHCFGKF